MKQIEGGKTSDKGFTGNRDPEIQFWVSVLLGEGSGVVCTRRGFRRREHI